jgi:hypothetical protein
MNTMNTTTPTSPRERQLESLLAIASTIAHAKRELAKMKADIKEQQYIIKRLEDDHREQLDKIESGQLTLGLT